MIAHPHSRPSAVRSIASRVLVASAAAIALVSASGFARAADTGQQAPLAKSASVRDLVSRVAGEWEGSVQVHAANAGNNARNSASIVGLSANVANATCSAVFAGAAFGKPFDGALVWNASDDSATWVLGDSTAPIQAALVSSSPGVLTFASVPEPIPAAKDAPCQTQHHEQVVRLEQDGHVKIELSRVVTTPQGQQRERIACLDVVKLPAGEPSLASGMASTSPQLALAQRASITPNTATASAE